MVPYKAEMTGIMSLLYGTSLRAQRKQLCPKLCLLSCNSQLSLANLAVYILWGCMGRIGDSDWKPLLVVSRWGYRRVVAQRCSFLSPGSLWLCGHSLNSEGLSEVPGKGDYEATNKKRKFSNDIPLWMVAKVWWQKKDLQCETANESLFTLNKGMKAIQPAQS